MEEWAPIEAMKLAEQGLANAVIRQRLRSVTEIASAGTHLGEAFEQEKGFPPILSLAIVTGEMRGNVADSLANLAEYYEDVTDRSVSGATELIQPAIIVVVAGCCRIRRHCRYLRHLLHPGVSELTQGILKRLPWSRGLGSVGVEEWDYPARTES